VCKDDPEKNKKGDIDRRNESGSNPGLEIGTIHGSDTFAGKPGSRNLNGLAKGFLSLHTA